MSMNDEIEQQKKLLETHRRTLANYLMQLAQFGTAYAPPNLLNGIHEARQNIYHIKRLLHGWNISVEDHPNDEDRLISKPDVVAQKQASSLTQPTSISGNNNAIIEVERGRVLMHNGRPIIGITFSPNNTFLISVVDTTLFSHYCHINLWKVDNGQLLDVNKDFGATISRIMFSSSGVFFAAADYHGRVMLWQVTNGQFLKLNTGYNTEGFRDIIFKSDDTLLVASGESELALWRANDNQLLYTLAGQAKLYSASFSNDGMLLASSSYDKAILLWRVTDGQLLHTLRSNNEMGFAAVSLSGKILITLASYSNYIGLWRVSDGQYLHTLTHKAAPYRFTESKDGILLATCSDETVYLWHLADGRLLHTLMGHTGKVDAMHISPDGTLLASGSRDNTVRIWRITDGRLLHTLVGHTKKVTAVRFSPDGKLLASSSDDSSVRLWHIKRQ